MDKNGLYKVEIDMHGQVAGVHKDDTIKIDGVNYGNGIRGFAVPYTRAGDLMRVELDVLVLDGNFRFKDCAYVGVPQETADLLITLGWTPPDGSNALVNALGRALDEHVKWSDNPASSHMGRTFAYCEAYPCSGLPAHERAEFRVDATGRPISRHPVGPFGPDATPMDAPPMKAADDDNA